MSRPDSFGLRSMARIFTLFIGKPYGNQTIFRWIRQEGWAVERQPQNSIDVCKMDELYTYVKKDCTTRGWTAADRNRLLLRSFDIDLGPG